MGEIATWPMAIVAVCSLLTLIIKIFHGRKVKRDHRKTLRVVVDAIDEADSDGKVMECVVDKTEDLNHMKDAFRELIAKHKEQKDG